nr:MAG TPA: hemolysin [Caudoviricetes sp.]
MNEENNFVTQEQCEERRNKIADDYETLKKRVDNHGKEIDTLNDDSIREDERLKKIENTFDILSKIMIAVVGALVLLMAKGALGI